MIIHIHKIIDETKEENSNRGITKDISYNTLVIRGN